MLGEEAGVGERRCGGQAEGGRKVGWEVRNAVFVQLDLAVWNYLCIFAKVGSSGELAQNIE